MKKNLLRYVLLGALSALAVSTLFSQAPGWQWAKVAGLPGDDDAGAAIASDASGNVYSIGSFGSSSLTIGTTTLTRSGGGNTYVIKQDPSGNVIWAKSFGFSPPTFFGINAGKGICVDNSGNVYITGYYITSMVLGTTTLTTTDSSSTVVGDIYVAKLNSSGTVLWAKSAGGAVADIPNGIAVDGSGNVYVAGTFRSRYCRFGSGITLFNQYSSSSNFYVNTDLFLAKYDASGNPVWARNTSSSGGGNTANGICTDASGNVVITGTYYSPNVVFGTNTLTATAAINLYVTKYDNSGNVLWAKTAIAAGSGSINHYGNAVSSDGSDNIYMTGWFSASTLTLGTIGLTTLGNSDLLVAKFDPLGNALWAKQAGGSNAGANGTAIKTTATGDSYVTGYILGTACSFGTVSVNNANTGGNNEDVFVAKYNSSGNLDWATGAGGNFGDISYGIGVDGSGNAVITGYTKSTSMAFGTLTVTSGGSYQDIIIAKMGNMSGIKEEAMLTGITIFPNPSNGILYVKSTSENRQANKITISDLMGRVIFEKEMTETTTQIDLSGSAKGIYFCRISSDNKSFTGKVVIQ